MIPNKIYLHWSATDYDWCEPGHYHSVTTGDGKVHRLTDYHEPLYEATFGRNTGSISLAMACMSPVGGTWSHAPKEEQIDAFCRECAVVALGLGWHPLDLEHKIMTHAEAAACRDYPRELVARFSGLSPSSDYDHAAQAAGLPHANYGPSSWVDGWPGGDVYRWDLWQLRASDKGGVGGHELRVRVQAWMAKLGAH